MEAKGILSVANSDDSGSPRRMRAKVLMVDDQPIIGEAIRHMLAGEDGVDFFFCEKPTEALAMAAKVKPTVILQDLVMPDVDGLTLVKFFRANPATRDVPLIVLSSKEDPDIKYKAFEFGANDYMVKFPDKLEVIARVRYHSRAYINLCERNDAMVRLQKSQAALKNELDEAARYVIGLLPERMDTPVLSTDWIFRSSTELGGDCFGYEWLDEESFAVYLLDVCGHGVGAALLSVSVMNVLRSKGLAGVDFKNPAEVLCGLNSAFDMDKQNGMYFTFWYGVFNSKTRVLEYASGGHPPAILIDSSGIKKLKTDGMVVGGFPGTEYKKASATVESGAKFFVFSDGVYEVEYADGSGMMSVDDFAEELKSDSGCQRKVEQMMRFSQSAQNRELFDDDFSLCEIIFR